MFNVTCLFLYPHSFECGQLKLFLHVSHLATVIVYSNVLDLSHNYDSVQRRIESSINNAYTHRVIEKIA